MDELLLPMFPLSTVLFPCTRIPLHIFEPRYQELVINCLSKDGRFGVVLIARGSEVGGGDDRTSIGTVAEIESARPIFGGRWHIVARGIDRIHIKAWQPDNPYPIASVEDAPSPSLPAGSDVLKRAEAAVRKARSLLSELGEVPALPLDLKLGEDPDAAAWRLCALAPIIPFDRQALLAITDPEERLGLLEDLAVAKADDMSLLLAGDTDGQRP